MQLLSQKTNYTCGPACLRMILSCYTNSLPSEQYLSTIAGTNKKIGTSRASMLRTAKSLGYKVRTGVKGSVSILADIENLIVLFKDTPNSFHYAIVLYVDDFKVVIADPWKGVIRSISLPKFLESWVCHNGTVGWWMSF